MHDFHWFNLFVAFNVLLLTLLGLNVTRVRIREQVANGDGNKPAMRAAIRAHGNGVEHVTVFALVLLALSFAPLPALAMPLLVILFSLARLTHAHGMLARNFTTRRIGAGLSFTLELSAVALLVTCGVW